MRLQYLENIIFRDVGSDDDSFNIDCLQREQWQALSLEERLSLFTIFYNPKGRSPLFLWMKETSLKTLQKSSNLEAKFFDRLEKMMMVKQPKEKDNLTDHLSRVDNGLYNIAVWFGTSEKTSDLVLCVQYKDYRERIEKEMDDTLDERLSRALKGFDDCGRNWLCKMCQVSVPKLHDNRKMLELIIDHHDSETHILEYCQRQTRK